MKRRKFLQALTGFMASAFIAPMALGKKLLDNGPETCLQYPEFNLVEEVGHVYPEGYYDVNTLYLGNGTKITFQKYDLEEKIIADAARKMAEKFDGELMTAIYGDSVVIRQMQDGMIVHKITAEGAICSMSVGRATPVSGEY